MCFSISSALGCVTHPAAEMGAPPLALHGSCLPFRKPQNSPKQLLAPDVIWAGGPDYPELGWGGTVHDIKQIPGFRHHLLTLESQISKQQDPNTIPEVLHPQLTKTRALLKSVALQPPSSTTGSAPHQISSSASCDPDSTLLTPRQSKSWQECPSVSVETFLIVVLFHL